MARTALLLDPPAPAILAFPGAAPPAARPAPNHALLDLMRRAARAAQGAARLDLAGACALAAPGALGAEAWAAALLRGLPDALGRRLIMHPSGARETTFDEAWVLALIGALARGDDTRLLAARLRPATRRQALALARGLATRLEPLYLEQF